MKYLYYPGCSLEATAREYDISTRAIMEALGISLLEIPDWTCCGASAAQATDRLLTLVLPAVNLAAAEAAEPGADILVPCSACYLNLRRIYETAVNDPKTLKEINSVLSVESLHYSGRARPRHLLDILSTDIGARQILPHISKNLGGLKVAPYYGCQCLRPYVVFDDPERPLTMEPLLKAAGAEIHQWSMGSKCCGASHMTTHRQAGMQLVYRILKAARGADVIATVCPMCQLNLEAYQKQISIRYKTDLSIPVYYLPQLLGLSMGILPEKLSAAPLVLPAEDYKPAIFV
jgi:heterodisulfide reductase subunit B